MSKTLVFTFTFVACTMLHSAVGPSAMAQNNSDRNRNSNQERSQRQRDDRQRDERQQVRIPRMLQNLDLESDQEQEIRQTIQQHNGKLQQTWRNFHRAHMKAVNLEAAWTAAVRDTLSDSDKQKFDQERRRHHQKMQRESEEQTDNRQASGNQDRQRTNQRESRAQQISSSRERDQQSDRQRSDRRQSDQQQADRRQSDQQRSDRGQSDRQQSKDSQGFYVVTITSPLIYTVDSRQSSQQKQQCSEACQKYTQQVRNAWQKATKLHNQLVQIEADKIQAIEEILTEDQLDELRDQRQQTQVSQQDDSEERYDNE